MSRLLRRLFALCVLSAGLFLCSGQPGYSAPEECSTCDFNYYNCKTRCDPSNPWCLAECRESLQFCSNGCTPDGMPYRPSCPSNSACANIYNNCDTNCVAEKDVCYAECPANDTSCYDVCLANSNSCRSFCQAEHYECIYCDEL